MACLLADGALASGPPASEPIPHASAKAKHSFSAYRKAPEHRAFAIAPGGGWGWESGLPSPEAAEARALANCQVATRQKCVLYASDDSIVFDKAAWPTLWGPYLSHTDAAAAPVGARVGERFFDIAYSDAEGQRRSLGESRGKVVFVHFWGSWCPPCLGELPSLQKLQRQLDNRLGDRVEVILLQVREAFQESRRWAGDNQLTDLPLYDSGSTGSDDTNLRLADGQPLEDRQVARAFPSSYVLDRNGIVLFAHVGPIEDWLEYLAFFEHAASQSRAAETVKPSRP
jgi:thiol-disulfide isomerase/thioredoxin